MMTIVGSVTEAAAAALVDVAGRLEEACVDASSAVALPTAHARNSLHIVRAAVAVADVASTSVACGPVRRF